MTVTWRVVLLLAAFVGVGVLTARGVMTHVATGGAMQPEVRLAGAMAGLFAGGAAAVLLGIALLLAQNRRR